MTRWFTCGLLLLASTLKAASAFAGPPLGLASRARAQRPWVHAARKQDEDIDIELDESTLDDQEIERLKELRRIMNGEGLENLMGTAPGYDDDDEEEDDIEVIDTDWSGQAGMDITLASSNNWGDIAQRKGLAFGDFAALTVFAWIGRSSHGSGAIDFGVLQTALPFYLGWFGVSPLLGSYANEATANQGEMIKKLAPAWGVSIPAGIAIRGLYKGEVPPVPFMVVSMVATGVALAAWRGAYTAVNPTSTANKRGGLLDGFKMVTTLLKRW